ncbi:MAG TPA: efflux RND transporter periplasmic adaptor subunit [Gemmatimonadales bacterium]|jgi:RND family efflux transporter MFP subunit|nr:efflux RND transporter periplasmic adaptor subunit [Gemmatimonadales bacterium]
MEAKNADLSALRIDRAGAENSSGPGTRRWLTIGLPAAAVVLLAGALVTTRGGLGSATSVHLTPATMVSPIRSGAVMIASGYVVAQRKAAVASKGTGRLVYLGVVEGDRVRDGQVLARIEDADVRAQLAQAQANLALSRAELHDAERTLARERTLLDSNFTSQAAYDAAEARLERVRAGIAVAQAAQQSAEVALENTVIRAPFAGTVLTKNADVGEVVAPLAGGAFSKSAVVTIADLRSLQVEADVAESNLEAISPGQPVEIVLDAYPDVRYPGYVAKIVPTADRAKATVQVKVAFRSYDSRVLPEMSAKVHFLPRPSRVAVDTQPVLVVPGTAVVERNGRSVVFVVEGGRAVEVPVVVGRQVGSSVAIREGLSPGVQVVDSVGASLRGGAKVTVQ